MTNTSLKFLVSGLQSVPFQFQLFTRSGVECRAPVGSALANVLMCPKKAGIPLQLV